MKNEKNEILIKDHNLMAFGNELRVNSPLLAAPTMIRTSFQANKQRP
jgi:hypothetical protein